jgi:hypothetical protein
MRLSQKIFAASGGEIKQWMSGHFFYFASRNKKNDHSFKMFFGGASRQGYFETASYLRQDSGLVQTKPGFLEPLEFYFISNILQPFFLKTVCYGCVGNAPK